MIRVAWSVPNTPGWIGGLNYFVNLGMALMQLPSRRIQPVLLGSAAGLPEPLAGFPTVPHPAPGPGVLGRLTARLWRELDARLLHDGHYVAHQLRRQGIRLLSHDAVLGRRSPVPAACWLPDFQHHHLPHLFTPEDLRTRLATEAAVAAHAQAIIFSSEDARQDYLQHHPHTAPKTHVLRFVAHAPPAETLPDAAGVLARYDIREPFFHVPNQLWTHKNHAVVAEALTLLAGEGRGAPLVVSTGSVQDYRNPEFFPALKARLQAAGLAERFRFLGLIPYPEVAVLMREAVALINPSLFEGWSTTVEEAKSLGKRLLLSNLTVHREQAPDRGVFFDPHAPAELAALMRQTLEAYSPQEEARAQQAAAAALPERMRQYALTYEDIVLRVTAAHPC
ncbi:MAG: glycosyltransferase [Desulfovibrio sp.]|nr:glycosyltransferase [Desulfovibrio sp.]